jgi:hypothetical protein
MKIINLKNHNDENTFFHFSNIIKNLRILQINNIHLKQTIITNISFIESIILDIINDDKNIFSVLFFIFRLDDTNDFCFDKEKIFINVLPSSAFKHKKMNL